MQRSTPTPTLHYTTPTPHHTTPRHDFHTTPTLRLHLHYTALHFVGSGGYIECGSNGQLILTRESEAGLYSTLHYTTLHHTTLHYTTLHYTTPHTYTNTNTNTNTNTSTRQHYTTSTSPTTLHCTTTIHNGSETTRQPDAGELLSIPHTSITCSVV